MNSDLFRGKESALENVSMVNRPLASHLLKIASCIPGKKPVSLHMWGSNEGSGRVPSYLIAFSCVPRFFEQPTLRKDVHWSPEDAKLPAHKSEQREDNMLLQCLTMWGWFMLLWNTVGSKHFKWQPPNYWICGWVD